MTATMWIDHVVARVPDLPAARALLTERHHLLTYDASLGGGARAICPLGSGQLTLFEEPGLPARLGWAVATDAFAEFEGATPSAPHPLDVTTRASGAALLVDGLLPVVVRPRRTAGHSLTASLPQPAAPVGIIGLGLQGDAAELAAWLGDAVDGLPIDVRPGPRELTEVRIASARGALHIRSTDLQPADSLATLVEEGQ